MPLTDQQLADDVAARLCGEYKFESIHPERCGACNHSPSAHYYQALINGQKAYRLKCSYCGRRSPWMGDMLEAARLWRIGMRKLSW